MRAADYAAAAANHGSEAQRRLAAGLATYGFGDVSRLSNPTSGRDDGIAPSRTAVVIAEDTCGRRLCIKFYDESAEATQLLKMHLKSLKAVQGVIPVPEIIGAEWTADRFGLRALVTTYLGEPFDHVVSRLSGDERTRVAEQIADSLVAMSRLELGTSGLRIPTKEELRHAVRRRFANDSTWYVEHASDGDGAARDLVLRGAEILACAELDLGVASLCHSDLVASNILIRDGAVSAFIDWDYAEVGPRELDLGVCMLGLLVTLPIPRCERLHLLDAMLEQHALLLGDPAVTERCAALPFALDALLDWTIGGKDAPLDDLVWALSGVVRAMEKELPLGEALH